jgi:type I restriction enzyme M protein
MSNSTVTSPFVDKFISQAIDILRGKVDTRDYHVVSLLLFLQKEGVIKNLTRLQPHNAKIELFRSIGNLNSIEKSQFRFTERKQLIRAIFDAFQQSVNKADDRTFYYLLQLIESIDEESMDKYFGELVEDLVYRIARSEGRLGGEYVQPFELTELICELADTPEGSSVYNPFAGTASFGVHLKQKVHYFGQEINRMSWAIGMLRLIASNKESYSDFVIGDSIERWNPYAEAHDFILANPPFALRFDTGPLEAPFFSIDSFVIEKSLCSLTSKGKAILVLSNNFLFSREREHISIRKNLIHDDLLEMVISFPSGLLTSTSKPFSAIVINKDKRYKGKTLFVNAESSIDEAARKDRRIDVKSLLSVIREVSTPNAKLIHNEEIIHNDFSFSVNRYLLEELPIINGRRLRDVLKIIKGTKGSEGSIGKFVSIKDLKSEKQDFVLNTNALEVSEIPKNAVKLEESALLVTIRGKALKPTFFEYKGEPIYISSDIVAYGVNEYLVNITYLVNELYADYVVTQLNRYRVGTVILFISKTDLLQVKIELPNMAEQLAKVKGISELLDQLQELKIERNTLAHGQSRKQFDEFASLKHTLGTPRQNILSYSEVMISFIENNQSNALNEVNAELRQALGKDLLSIFKSIRNDINFISELLEKGEQGLVLEEHKMDEITIVELQSLINGFKGAFYKFNIDVREAELEDEQNMAVVANRVLFKAMLSNLLTNADKHGFDKKEEDNEVVVDLSIVDNMFVIDIKNNGKPFPRNFDKDKFITRYSTADANNGSGLGGYDINRIVTYFNGTWDLILNEDKIYPVRFSFQFPITLTK